MISRSSSPAIFFSAAGSFQASTVGEQLAQRQAAVLVDRAALEPRRRRRRRAAGCRRTGCTRSRRRGARAGRAGAARGARPPRGRGRGLCIGSGRRRQSREVGGRELRSLSSSDSRPRASTPAPPRTTPRPCRTAPGRRWRGDELRERHVERQAGAGARAPRASRRTAAGRRSATRARRPRRASAACCGTGPRGWRRLPTPRPSHAGHQPSGLLNEKWCGESGSKLRPHVLHTRCWLWTFTGQRSSGWPSSTTARCITPRPRASAVSTLSASRARASLRIVTRSTITSTSCLRRRSIAGTASSSCVCAVDADAEVAVALELGPQVLVLLALGQLDGGHEVRLRAVGLGEHGVDDLVGRLRADGRVALGAVQLAEPRHAGCGSSRRSR